MSSRVPEGFAVSLLGKEILPPPLAKSLGVVMDSHLSFDEHVADLATRTSGYLRQINRENIYLTDQH